MQAAYNRDLPRAQTPPAEDGSCEEANYEASYDVEDEPGGRIACRDRIGTSGFLFREMEWTNDELLVLAFISNRLKTWDELIDFWVNLAGPYAPG